MNYSMYELVVYGYDKRGLWEEKLSGYEENFSTALEAALSMRPMLGEDFPYNLVAVYKVTKIENGLYREDFAEAEVSEFGIMNGKVDLSDLV